MCPCYIVSRSLFQKAGLCDILQYLLKMAIWKKQHVKLNENYVKSKWNKLEGYKRKEPRGS